MHQIPRRARGLAVLFAASAALASLTPAAAGDASLADLPAFSLEPAQLLAAAEDARPEGETDLFVLFYETRFTFDEAGRMHYVRRRVYQVLSERLARSWNDTAMNWEPWHQERPEIRARVVTGDGAAHWLDPATLTDVTLGSGERDIYQDRHQLGGPLPAVEPGAVVEEVIEVVDREPLFAAGIVRRQFLSLSSPLVHGRVVLDAPEGLPLHWTTARLPGVEPVEDRTGGRVRLTFDVRDLEEIDDEAPGLPPDVPRFAYVAFATGASWNQVARSYSEVVDRQIGDFDPGAPAAPDAGADRRARIAASVASVHAQVRYTGLELGEAAIVPRTPDDVLMRRYGDCKDKATLLVALLRTQGIPAHVALLDAGPGEDVDPRLPGLTGLGGFDHAIVYVPAETPDEPDLWIDATDPFSPLGELPPGAQGRLALVAAPATTALVRTPESRAADNHQVIEREIVLAELGKGSQTESASYRGAQARELRSAWAVAGDRIREALAGGGELEVEGLDELAQPLGLRVHKDVVDHAATDPTEAVAAISRSGLLERLPPELTDGEAEPREHDYVVAEPHIQEWRFRIVPPPGFVLRELPDDEERTLGPASYAADFEREGEEVQASLRFTLDRRRLSAEEFEALRTAAADLSGEDPLLFWFDHQGALHLRAGRVAEALAEYRRLAALHPDEALHQVQLADALLSGGLGAEAREAARRATEVEPDSALAYRMLGQVLASDPIGRRFTAGFDRDGARAAFEKAIELDPEDLDAQVQLALVLEHDEAGERYGTGADLDRAIEVYRSIQDRIAGTVFRDNLHFALLRAGRYEELAEALEKDAQTPARRALLAAAEAMTLGPEPAIRRAERRGDADERRQALLQAGQHLYLGRRYAQAAELTAAGARSAPNAAELLQHADALRRTRRHEEIEATPDTPDGVVRALMLTQAGPEPDLDAFTRLLAPSVRPAFEEMVADDETRAELLAVIASSLEAGGGGVDPVIALDLSLSLPYDVSGDDATGYRVRLVPPGPQVPDGMYAYVVTADGGYRVAGLSTVAAMLGAEALARVERGEVATARLWLDWAAELMPPAGDRDDPLAGGVLPLLWTRGAEADAAEVRIAAAALSTGGGLGDAAVAPLSARLAQAEGREKHAIMLALALHHLAEEEWEEALAAAEGLEAELPRSESAFVLAQTALYNLERHAELVARAERRSAALPGDLVARRFAAEGLMYGGELAKAAEIYRAIEGDGRAESSDYNQLAWLGLFGEHLEERALGWAQRAAELDGYAESASLHTLATVYAEAGRPADAYRVILQAIEARAEPEPEAADWYVFGRLAELYGLPDAATAYYRRAEEPDDAHGASTTRLAERRLAALAAAGDG